MDKIRRFKIWLEPYRDPFIKWLNWLFAALAAFDFSGLLSSLPWIQPYIPAHLYQYALTGVAIMNFVSHNFLKHRDP